MNAAVREMSLVLLFLSKSRKTVGGSSQLPLDVLHTLNYFVCLLSSFWKTLTLVFSA